MARKKALMKTGYIVEELDFLFTHGHGNLTDEKLSALQCIKHFCCECQGGHYHDWRMSDGSVAKKTLPYDAVEDCTTHTCYLYPYRMGKRPSSK
jgi:hypothetical protein